MLASCFFRFDSKKNQVFKHAIEGFFVIESFGFGFVVNHYLKSEIKERKNKKLKIADMFVCYDLSIELAIRCTNLIILKLLTILKS